MFAPNIVTVTITNIEGGINMFAAIIITTVVLILAAIVAALLALTLTDYSTARAVIDAIPFDPDVVDAAIARIPGTIKRWAENAAMCGTVLTLTAWKTSKNATKEAWHNVKTVTNDISWAISAIGWLCAIVFNGICNDVTNLISSCNAVIDNTIEHIKRLRGMIAEIIRTNKAIAVNGYGDMCCIAKTMAFYAWRFGVSIKDAISLTLDFVCAAWYYTNAHIPGILTAVQVGTWNAITSTIHAIIDSAKNIARFVRDVIGIFAAIGKLISWVSGGISLDADKALTKVANSF